MSKETLMRPISSAFDHSIDVLRVSGNPLDAIFSARSVAVVGATERKGSVGRTTLENLVHAGFAGSVYPVNPKHSAVLGMTAYPDLSSLPSIPDLAVIITPANTVPSVMKDVATRGIPGAVVISAGFKERGEEGLLLENEIAEIARRAKLRVIGPNCVGVMNPHARLNATFAHDMALPGNVAFLSQSGALCTAILDWSLKERVGFSAFVSVGSMVDVGWGDLIWYFGEDLKTESILIYMESVGDAASFLSAAREVALRKPIIVIKAGRTAAAAKAAASHTGALAGSDSVLDAAFHRCGVMRVDTIADLFDMAEVLSKQPRPAGRRLAIVTNAGGPGVLATDALMQGTGELAALSEDSMANLDSFLPEHWSHGNPIDVLGDADVERYRRAFSAALTDTNTDGLLAIMSPQGMTDPARVAEALVAVASTRTVPKPVLASLMGAQEVAAGEQVLNQGGIPTFSFPDAAARAFNYMWQYSANLDALYETPGAAPEGDGRHSAQAILRDVSARERTLLTEDESKRLLAAYGIPAVDTRVAHTAKDAAEAALAIGFPVVVKLHSETITHKTDVGGVLLGLQDQAAVRAGFEKIRTNVDRVDPAAFGGVTVQPMIRRNGYELILGSHIDAQFGPVLLVGAGGQLVEVFRDTALALPPLTTTLARRVIERTRISKALHGVRGRASVDLTLLEQVLVRFSQLVVENPRIAEIDINPLLVSPESIIALDARVIMHPASMPDEQLPRSAIRPYPSEYVTEVTSHTGEQIVLRPIRPDDEPRMVEFHHKLSDRTVQLRYMHNVSLAQRIAHDRLRSICFTDYNRDLVFVAIGEGSELQDQVLAVGRLSRLSYENGAEIGVLVRDDQQRKGLGREVLAHLVKVATREKLAFVRAVMLESNDAMKHLAKEFGFTFTASTNNGAGLSATLATA
jgi:acetyltransferase